MDLAAICQQATQQKAGDIHLKVGRPPFVRIHGHLKALPGHPDLTQEELGQSIWAIMSGGAIA